MKNFLPSNIRHLRLKNRLKQEEFAKIFGVARSTVGNYENGLTEPNIEMIIKFSEYFKVDITDLIIKDLTQDEPPNLPYYIAEAQAEFMAQDKFQVVTEKLDKMVHLLEQILEYNIRTASTPNQS
ncbi:MAG: helix-turn-helix transcriptional regulator [Bacteroidota bacterium]